MACGVKFIILISFATCLPGGSHYLAPIYGMPFFCQELFLISLRFF
jgi:hypothetical protein